MKNKSIMYCEKPYLQRVADCYKKDGMMYKFYLWLDKINRKKKNER